MTSYFSSDYNAVNIIRNGGFDFAKPDSAELPFWEIDGARLKATPPNNSFEIVVRQTQESEIAAARYMKLLLSSDDEVKIIQPFYDRWIQMAFGGVIAPPSWSKYEQKLAMISTTLLAQERFHTDLKTELMAFAALGCQYNRAPLTFAFSVRVPRGRASLKVVIDNITGGLPTYEIGSHISSEDWFRPVKPLQGISSIRSLQIVVAREPGAGSTEVHLGAFMLSPGTVSELPYTGDPMADAFPENTIVFAYGYVCPPGFEPLSFTAPKEKGRIFPKGGEYASDDVVGEELHDHDDARVTMNPERDWPVVELIPSPTEGPAAGDDATTAHSHSKEEALHVPPSKDVILCKRISWNQGG